MSNTSKLFKILSGAAVVGAGVAAGIGAYKYRKMKNELLVKQKQLEDEINELTMESSKKSGNIHFIKNCLQIMQDILAEEVNNDTMEENINHYQRINNDIVKSIEAITPLIQHFTYAIKNPWTTIDEEAKHLITFIEFVKIRSHNKANITHNIDPALLYGKNRICCCIFPEVLENAYKHSYISNEDDRIDVQIKCSEENLIFTVSNPIYVSKQDLTEQKDSRGIGEMILKKRLIDAYDNNFELTTRQNKNRYSVTLKLPFTI
ncbi:MAG: GHKL domain-containing protein [Prolixibacteraceae bacterium]|jgi:LytS/YehU family sensor histidine kinase|nr:GHKL domain-containing protein [Prolixibacteraceae bacterium]